MQGTWRKALTHLFVCVCVSVCERVVLSVQWAFLCCWLSLFRWWETDVLALCSLSFFRTAQPPPSFLPLSLCPFLRFPRFQQLKAPWFGSKEDISACYFQRFSYSQSHTKAFCNKCVIFPLFKVTMPEAFCECFIMLELNPSCWKCIVNSKKCIEINGEISIYSPSGFDADGQRILIVKLFPTRLQ